MNCYGVSTELLYYRTPKNRIFRLDVHPSLFYVLFAVPEVEFATSTIFISSLF